MRPLCLSPKNLLRPHLLKSVFFEHTTFSSLLFLASHPEIREEEEEIPTMNGGESNAVYTKTTEHENAGKSNVIIIKRPFTNRFLWNAVPD